MTGFQFCDFPALTRVGVGIAIDTCMDAAVESAGIHRDHQRPTAPD